MSTQAENRRKTLQALVDRDTLSAVARAAGKPPSQIKDMLAGRKSFGEKVARAIEDAYRPGGGYGWLETWDVGQELPLLTGQSPTPPAMAELYAAEGQIKVWDTPNDLPVDENRVWIDRYDYKCSAGDGIIQWETRQKSALPFTGEFFKAINSRPASCRLVEARGDSMEPYLFNRDMIMIDTDKTEVRDGHIYAVCFEGESLVKQLFKQSGGLLTLHSYNPKYPDRLVQLTEETDFQVVGEIVYRSGAGQAAS